MKTVLGLALLAGTALAVTPAGAADVLPMAMPNIVTPTTVVQPAEDSPWAGFYVGGHVGYGLGNFPIDMTYSSGAIFYADPHPEPFQTLEGGDGFLFGIQVGANAQMGNIVLGVETDFSKTYMDAAGGPYVSLLGAAWNITSTLNYLGTARVRVGFAPGEGRFLVYATGGLAWGLVDTTQATTFILGPVEGGRTAGTNAHIGWTVGAGAEVMLGDRLSINAQYLFVHLGEQNYALEGTTTPDGVVPYVETFGAGPITAHTLRLGVNLHL